MESREDSVADLLAAPRLLDPVEREAAFEEVAQALFARAQSKRRIGRYQVGRQLGRGGQGIVYAAYDPELERRVAIKILQVQESDHGATARLRREAQALARLSHPNVIAINDVGVCPAGVYLVMQYEPGCTLSEWLRGERSWRDSVAVMAAAGRGLAAAHEHGVVHRDFKPSNVWMGDDGVVRLLDFGLAEVGDCAPIGSSTTARTSSTSSQTAEIVVAGTPAYMAPEQHGGEPATEASDQYAYCVTLYEALFGCRPFAAPSLDALVAAKARADMLSPPPERSIPPRLWRIVTRGLRPAPTERWPSMTALVDAIEQCTRPRRHLGRVALAVVAVAGATALAAWGGREVDHARRVAACGAEADRIDETWNPDRAGEIAAAMQATGVSYATDTWSRARGRVEEFAGAWKETRRQACEAADVDGTLIESLATASRECLDERRDTLDALLAQFVEQDAMVVRKVATATASLPQLRECTDEAALRRRIARPSDPASREQARAMRARLTEAAAAIMAGRDAVGFQLASEVRDEARRDARPLLVVEATLLMGISASALGRLEEGARTLEESFFDARAAGDDVLALRAAAWLVSTVGSRLARREEGLKWVREAEGLLARMNLSGDLATAGVLANAANLHFVQAEYEPARDLAERALEIKEDVLGAEHPEIANALNTLGSIRFRQGEHDAALGLHERALAIQEEALGAAHPDVGITFSNIATVYLDRSDYENALEMFERALAVWRAALGGEHPTVAVALNNAAVVHQLLDAPGRARELSEEALAIQAKILGPDHPEVGAVSMNLANSHLALGEHDRAKALYLRALAINEKALGPEHPEVARTLDNLGVAHRRLDEPAQALELHERALTIWEKVHGPDHHETARTLNNLGDVHRVLGAYDRAETMHRRALAIWEKTHGPEHPEVGRSLLGLGDVEADRHAHSSALPHYERALAIYEGVRGEAQQLAAARFAVARALREGGGDRARATRLAELARDAYRARGRGVEKDLAEVVAWLDGPARRTNAP
jgi:tetratricopeptide (TPR) repeat protein